MTEADEVAATIAAGCGAIPRTLDQCRALVRRDMPDESEQVIDNVAWSLMLCGRAVHP